MALLCVAVVHDPLVAHLEDGLVHGRDKVPLPSIEEGTSDESVVHEASTKDVGCQNCASTIGTSSDEGISIELP